MSMLLGILGKTFETAEQKKKNSENTVYVRKYDCSVLSSTCQGQWLPYLISDGNQRYLAILKDHKVVNQ